MPRDCGFSWVSSLLFSLRTKPVLNYNHISKIIVSKISRAFLYFYLFFALNMVTEQLCLGNGHR